MKHTEILRACPWMLEARALIGTREVHGPRHSSAVLRMWETVKAPFRDDETPWCAAFVGHCMEMAGIRSTKSAAARSYAKWGDTLVGPYQAAYGAVVVLNRPGSSWSGHVGFLTGYDPDAEVFLILGGNQANRVQHSEFPRSRLVTIRWPQWGDHAPVLRCPPFTARGQYSRGEA
jgi:uncharacterized protein (TIGR02594 family)